MATARNKRLFITICAFSVWAASPAFAEYPKFIEDIIEKIEDSAIGVEPPTIFDLSGQVPEVSGAAYSKATKMLWTLPDSGNPALLGRTDLETFETRTFNVTGAENEDWEAILLDRERKLWVLDVGDNNSVRNHVSLYRVDPERANGDNLPVIQQVNVLYPEGPMNVEAGAILNNRIYLFEKTLTHKPKIVSVDISFAVTNPSDIPPMRVARSEGELPMLAGPITDASLSPTGSLYLLTYAGVYEVPYWWSKRDRYVETIRLLFWGQIETLVALSDDHFLIGRESGKFFLLKR